jgi:hypothetical protein
MVQLTDAQAQGVPGGIPTDHQIAKLESVVYKKKYWDLNTRGYIKDHNER